MSSRADSSLAPPARLVGDRDPLRTDLFLSYAQEDQAFARRLVAALAKRGKRVWVDWDDIPPVGVAAADFSPDARSLVTVGEDDGRRTIGGRIAVWDVSDGRDGRTRAGLLGFRGVRPAQPPDLDDARGAGARWPLRCAYGRRLAAIDTSAQSAAAAPDGRRLVVVDDENTAVIVGVSSRTFVPLAHPGGVWRAAFSADGRLVATRHCPPPSLKRTGHL